jgi:hypothetical protein
MWLEYGNVPGGCCGSGSGVGAEGIRMMIPTVGTCHGPSTIHSGPKQLTAEQVQRWRAVRFVQGCHLDTDAVSCFRRG